MLKKYCLALILLSVSSVAFANNQVVVDSFTQNGLPAAEDVFQDELESVKFTRKSCRSDNSRGYDPNCIPASRAIIRRCRAEAEGQSATKAFRLAVRQCKRAALRKANAGLAAAP